MAGFDVEFPLVPGAFEDFAFAGVGHAGEAVGEDEGAKKLAGLDSVAVKKLKKGEGVLADNEAVEPKVVKRLGKGKVREGEF